MRDYKNFAKRLNTLKKEIETSLERVQNKQKPADFKINKKNYQVFASRKNKTKISLFDKIKNALTFSAVKNFCEKNMKICLPKIDFSHIRIPDVHIARKAVLPSVATVLLFLIFLGFRSLIFSAAPNTVASAVESVSFIGDLKIKEEFKSMNNTMAVGGNDISAYNKEDPELRFFFYKVKQGESISSIAKKLGVSSDTIVSLNSMGSAHNISVGNRILVPNMKGILYTVKSGDTCEKIAKTYKIKTEDIITANDLEGKTIQKGDVMFLPGASLTELEKAKIFGYLFIKPLNGRFTSPFGIRKDPFTGKPKFHAGIDIAAPYGTPIKAAKDGKVTYAGWKSGYGNVVIIEHQFGYTTLYGHMSKILVSVGQYVKGGQYIGKVGSTGKSTGPHCHFEVHKFGMPTDPLTHQGLKKAPGKWY
jgi:murein DD-endopeptidase MepM/ murein hydrolase activator NlpD